MKNQKLTALAGVVAALALSVTISACGSNESDSSANQSGNTSEVGSGAAIVSFDQINQEYKNTVSKLDWPQSYAPPADLQGEDQNSSFQTGYGDTRASQLFECAWEREWVDTYATDKEKAAKALEELSKVPDMGYMSPARSDESVRRFFNDYMDRAKLGDPSGFQENIQLNCPETNNGK